jgi:AAHS family 4-hydroxybenzoate transporter-like MFS transporter
VFGVFTLACAAAQHPTSLLLNRFLAGIGLGGAIPNLMAPAAEYAPERRRSSLVVIILWGFPLGAILGGLLSTVLITRYGWPSVFYLGGALPLLALPLFLRFMPESIRFLALRPGAGAGAALAQILSRIDRTRAFSPTTSYFLPEPAAQEGIRALFDRERWATTLLLSIAFFMSLLLSYLLVNWIPLLLHQAGIPVAKALIGTVVLNFSGIIGSFVISKRMDATHRRLTWIGSAYILSAVAVTSIGLAGTALFAIMLSIFATGFLLIGAQMSLASFVASSYPTSIRATAIGWMQAIGRVGSLLGPLIGGWLLSFGASPAQLFAFGSIPALLSALALLSRRSEIDIKKFG